MPDARAVASWLVRLAGISLCGAHCLLIGLLAGHGPRPLDPHRACRDAYTTTSPALGAGRGGYQEEAVDVDSNASFAGEVERNVSPDNDFSLRGKLHQVRSDPGRLLASLRGRRTCISASSMSGAGGRSQTDNLSPTKRLHYRLCYASGW